MLFRALSYISPENLAKALLVNPVDVEITAAKSSPLDRKEAVERWSKWPLKTVGDVEGWYGEQKRFTGMGVQGDRIGTLGDRREIGGFQPARVLDEPSLPSISVNEVRQSIAGGFAGDSLEEVSPIDSNSMRSMGNDDVGLVGSEMGMATQMDVVQNPSKLQNIQTQRHQQEHSEQSWPNRNVSQVANASEFEPDSSKHGYDLTRSTGAAGLGLTQEFRDDFLW